MISLTVEKREQGASLGALRKAGRMPAVFYGRKQRSVPISIPVADFIKVWKKVGESGVVTVKLGADELESLIYEVDLDPLTDKPRHADFYVFEKGQRIKIKVPIEFSGVSPAVKDLGAVLVKVLRELEIEAAPKDLPREVKVDISSLVDFKSQLLAKQSVLPAGVTLLTSPDEVVALVYEPKEIVEEAAPIAPDLSTIEVEKKGKEVPEGEEAAPAQGATAKAPAKEAAPAKEKK
jgi:large subunit ribosomal protein L25